MPNSLKCRLKNLVRKGLLSEKDLERIVIIPIDATNGDVEIALHPNAKVVRHFSEWEEYVEFNDGKYVAKYNMSWWNAKFER